MALELDRVYLGDCLELMQEMPDESVDLILTDPPFGITKNRWDVPVPFDRMWGSFSRVTKDSSPMVIFGIPPFSSQLIVSNPKMYRYTWIWDKRLPVGFLNANRAPLRRYETISVFSRKGAAYYPQMTLGKPYRRHRRTSSQGNYGEHGPNITASNGTRYPTDIIEAYPHRRVRGGHPTQKPIDLLEYLISTYTQPGDIVLDPFLGSGATAIACLRTGRHFVGIEKHEPYFIKAQEWIDKERAQVRLSGSPDDGGVV